MTLSVNREVVWPKSNQSATCFICIAWRSVSALASTIQEAGIYVLEGVSSGYHASVSSIGTECKIDVTLGGKSATACIVWRKLCITLLGPHVTIPERDLYLEVQHRPDTSNEALNTPTQLSLKLLHKPSGVHPLYAKPHDSAHKDHCASRTSAPQIALTSPGTAHPQVS